MPLAPRRAVLHAALAAALSLLLHAALGWAWTLAAGFAGACNARRSVGASALGVGAGWALAMLYQWAAAPAEFLRAVGLVGALAGGAPAAVLLLVPALGAALGLLGGLCGRAAYDAFARRPQAAPAAG